VQQHRVGRDQLLALEAVDVERAGGVPIEIVQALLDGVQAPKRWLERLGADGTIAERGPVFNQASLAIDAAVAGQGVALARSALAALDLAAGRLVRPIPQALPAAFAYWIVCPKATADEGKITRFRAWLLAQAASDAAAD
jgi:DNA-binding transcriptional LysR family regulator